MASHLFYHILFFKSKSIRSVHTQGEGITQSVNTRRWGSLGTIQKAAYHGPPESTPAAKPLSSSRVERGFSNFTVHSSHLEPLLACRSWSNNCRGDWDATVLTGRQVLSPLLIQARTSNSEVAEEQRASWLDLKKLHLASFLKFSPKSLFPYIKDQR